VTHNYWQFPRKKIVSTIETRAQGYVAHKDLEFVRIKKAIELPGPLAMHDRHRIDTITVLDNRRFAES
jgi:hypothetical protein